MTYALDTSRLLTSTAVNVYTQFKSEQSFKSLKSLDDNAENV